MVESFSLQERLVKEIEGLVESTGLYGSKSEFYREAVREKYLKLVELEEIKKKQDRVRKRFVDRLKKRKTKVKELTKEEKIEIADNHLKKQGLSEVFGR